MLIVLLIMLMAGVVDSRAQSCAIQDCRTTSIQLNTGRNHASDELYNSNTFDSWWGIEADNDPNTAESRRAAIMPAYPGWPTQQNSAWAWRDLITSDPLAGTTVYYTEFEVCDPGMMQLNLSVIAPDGGQVTLNGTLLFLVAPGLAPTAYSSGVPVAPGINVLRVEVDNTGSPAVGLNLVGTISAGVEGLISRQCGPYKNGISLFVFDDLDQDGEADEEEAGISNVEIALNNPSGQQTAYSSGDGRVWFETGVGESNLSVVAPPGWYIVAGTTHTVSLAAGASAVSLMSALTTCPTIQILKFNDANCNGVRDSNEVAMPGWVINFSNGQQGVTLRGPRAIKLCGSTTSVVVSEVVPPNTCWVQTYPSPATTHTITLIPGVWVYEAFFGNSSTGTVRISKFNDLNGNGQRDPGEPGLPNWEFTITSATLNQVVQTGPGGFIEVPVTCGTYTICETLQSGWCPTTPACRIVTVAACSLVDAEFGNTQQSGVCIRKFNDRNCNKVQDVGEESLAGWTFNLSSGGTSVSVTTGTTGVTCATLTAGTWTICEVTKAGWTPTMYSCTTITISACETKSVTFGNASTGSICVFKYEEKGTNAQYNPGVDTPLQNWVFEVWNDIETQLITTGTTDASGWVCFTDLPLGDYLVKEIQQSGWVATQPHPLDPGYYFTVTACCNLEFHFGNKQQVCQTGICIQKFNDRNCNKVQDVGEESLAGWTFNLSSGGTSVSVTTGTTGVTCATLTAGIWTICEVTKAGWTPTMYSCTTITISACETKSVTFGNASTGSICVFKYEEKGTNAQYNPGVDTPLQNWVFEVWNDIETQLITTGTTDASGWVCFTDLPLGDYLVKEIQQSGWVATQPHPLDPGYYFTVTACCNIEFHFGNKNTCETKICVHKFNDLNCNGTQESNEENLSGWTFNLSSGGVTVSVTTGTTGKACAIVTAGVWLVKEVTQAGWIPVGGNTGAISVTIAACQTKEVTFANASTGTLCITKYHDLNCDNVRQAGENTLPNWTFLLNNGVVTIPVTTGLSGTTCATVPAGNWMVSEVTQAGWIPKPPQPVTVVTCGSAAVTFANCQMVMCQSTICVVKYNDKNCSGTQDAGDDFVSGWRFQITNGVTSIWVTTGTTGRACATVTAGTWTVCEELRAGWTPTGSTPANGCTSVTVLACQTQEITFSNSSTGAIRIFKFNDFDCNGQQNGGELPIQGWKMTVVGPTGAVYNLTTDGSGFATMLATSGTYTIYEEQRSCWRPFAGTTAVVQVTPCQVTSASFANSSTGTLNILKFNDLNGNGVQDGGEPPLQDWEFNISGVGIRKTDAAGMIWLPVTCGTYTICEIQQPGWKNTTLLCTTASILPCEVSQVKFGNQQCTGRICITKFNDRNCDGVRQPASEELLPGWTFNITNGLVTVSVTTGSLGTTCATVTTGSWTVTEVVKVGWQQTTPGFGPQIITCGTGQVDLTFGNASTGTLCITKYHDIDCDGVRQAAEVTLPGWTFTLSSGATVINVTTDASGTTCATVPAGIWTVCEVTQAGWMPKPCQQIAVSICNVSPVTFGNCLIPVCPSTICVVKFNDKNCDGVQQLSAGEDFLPGWVFRLQNGATTIWVTTGTMGKACTTVAAGTWTVCEVTQAGWIPTNGTGCAVVTVATCQTKEVTFANSSSGTLCITKFNDRNCNGIQELALGETNLSGWTFNLTKGAVTIQVTTGTTGVTCATVPAGAWTVCEVPKAGWAQTTLPVCPVAVVSICNSTPVKIGNSSTGTVCGFKYNDINNNGAYDVGIDVPMSNWTIELWNSALTVLIASGTTNTLGEVCFTVPAGSYRIREIQKVGWVATQPVPPVTNYPVTVGICSNQLFRFGNRPQCPNVVCITKYHDVNCNGVQDPGEPSLPNWTFDIKSGPTTIMTVTTGPTGTTCATLPNAGIWTICEVTKAGWSPSNGIMCTTVTVDCQVRQVAFGNASRATICAYKYNDLDSNGTFNGADYVMPNWPIELWNAAQTVLIGSGLTDATGRICFYDLPLGNYFLKELQLPNWVQTEPAFPATGYAVNLARACSTYTYMFGNNDSCDLFVCGVKYWERVHNQEACNGIIDPDETGLAHWQIIVTDPVTGWSATGFTDSLGYYCVQVPHSGTYDVTEVIIPGFMPAGSYPPTQPAYVDCNKPRDTVEFLNCPCPNDPVGSCRADSLHILSDPSVFRGNTVLVMDPFGPRLNNGYNVTPFVPAPPIPGAEWIGPNPMPGPPDPNGPYRWIRPFCVCEGMSHTVVRVRLCFKGIHDVRVFLNGVFLGMYTYPGPDVCIDTSIVVGPGCHNLEFHVMKHPFPPNVAALSYNGSIVGPGVMKDMCCECYSKYVDPHVPVEMRQNTPDPDTEHKVTPGVGMPDAELTTGVNDQSMPAFDPALTSVPNPANGATVVSYTLPRSTEVRLELYNSVGRHMITLADGPQREGRHSVPLDMAEMPSGFYHLRLTAGGRVYTLRLMSIK